MHCRFCFAFSELANKAERVYKQFLFFFGFFCTSQKSYMEMALSDFGENRRRRPVVAVCCLLIALSLFSDALLSPALAQRASNVS